MKTQNTYDILKGLTDSESWQFCYDWESGLWDIWGVDGQASSYGVAADVFQAKEDAKQRIELFSRESIGAAERLERPDRL